MTIKEIRLRAGLTQAEVAARLDINQSAVSGWERGKSRPVRKSRGKLAELYKCTVEELLNGCARA